VTRTTLLESAWRLQHRIEDWYARPRPRKEEDPRFAVNPEWVMAGGVAWAILGLLLREYYWVLGGFLLFYMGVMALPVDLGQILSSVFAFPRLVVRGGYVEHLIGALPDQLSKLAPVRSERELRLDSTMLGHVDMRDQPVCHHEVESVLDRRDLGPELLPNLVLVHLVSGLQEEQDWHTISEAHEAEWRTVEIVHDNDVDDTDISNQRVSSVFKRYIQYVY